MRMFIYNNTLSKCEYGISMKPKALHSLRVQKGYRTRTVCVMQISSSEQYSQLYVQRFF